MVNTPNAPTEAIDVDLICGWLKDAGRIALDTYRLVNTVRFKEDNTPTTAVDHEIEAFLLKRIQAQYPSHQIMTEESGIHGNRDAFLWVIDPLDGTRAFASGLPTWGISIGVLRDGAPFAGAFAMPAVGDLLWGGADGAFYNGQPLLPRDTASLDDPLAFLAVPSNAHLLYNISFGRLRSLGSTAAHLAYVARGAAIGALTRRVKLWDLAGVLPILKHTGIELRYLSGAPFDVRDLLQGETAPEPLVAAHATIIDDVLDTIRIKG